jgi:AcrR family transcriptional regulator
MRGRISDAATALFLERGFDEVSVTEIADAADVARPTVFAHFPRKEDLLLDRFDDALADLVAAVRDRSPDEPPAAAAAGWFVARALAGEPPLGVRAEYRPFWALVAGSRALRARAREMAEVAEARLADELAAAGAAQPRVAAALLGAAVRAVHLQTVTGVLAGAPAPDPATHAGHLARVLDVVRVAVERLDDREEQP